MKRLTRFVLARLFRRNCLNCAYFKNEKFDDTNDFQATGWKGFHSECLRGDWNRSWFQPGLGEDIIDRVVWRTDGTHEVVEKSVAELKEEFGEWFDENKILTEGGRWLDLSAHSCRYFFPEAKRASRTREKCWDEHKKMEERRRFWIPTIISAVALGISGLGIWRPWE